MSGACMPETRRSTYSVVNALEARIICQLMMVMGRGDGCALAG